MLEQKERYKSPSTPDLRINFRAYAVELVCLNMNPGLGPRFWRSGYWSSKFRREMAGLKRFVQEYSKTPEMELTFQMDVLAAIQLIHCQSLLSKANRIQLWQAMQGLHKITPAFDATQNAIVVPLNKPSGAKGAIRQIEVHGG